MQKIKLPAMAAMVATSLIPRPATIEGVIARTPSSAAMVGEDAIHITDPARVAIDIGENVAQSRTVPMVFPAVASWSNTKERRFKELAVQEALGELSPATREELRALDALREQKLSPPSGEEVLRQYRARQVTANLLLALSEYVTFFGHAPKDCLSPASIRVAD